MSSRQDEDALWRCASKGGWLAPVRARTCRGRYRPRRGRRCIQHQHARAVCPTSKGERDIGGGRSVRAMRSNRTFPRRIPSAQNVSTTVSAYDARGADTEDHKSRPPCYCDVSMIRSQAVPIAPQSSPRAETSSANGTAVAPDGRGLRLGDLGRISSARRASPRGKGCARSVGDRVDSCDHAGGRSAF